MLISSKEIIAKLLLSRYKAQEYKYKLQIHRLKQQINNNYVPDRFCIKQPKVVLLVKIY